MENTHKDSNFAKAFYFLASITIFFWAINGLSNILTPIAIAILIWFLINAFADQIKRIPFLNNKIGDYISIPLSLVIIVYLMFEIGSFIASSMFTLSSTISSLDGKVMQLIEKLSVLTSFDLVTPLQKILQEFSLAMVINKVISAFSTIFGNIVQILLYVLFLLLDQRFFNIKLNALFPNNEHKNRAKHVLKTK